MKGKTLLVASVFLLAGTADAGTLTGEVAIQGEDKALPGARIQLKGTAYVVTTGKDGAFRLKDLPDGTYTLKVTAPGYLPKEVEVTLSGDGSQSIKLLPASALSETIIITAQRAQVRDSPVAFSNVTGDEIAAKYTTQDTPQLLDSVPGVFAQTSGLGESNLTIRGMDGEHVQVMINNVPVNDPESQVVYWSNWTGLSGNAADIQVQRGVGTSLLGSGAFGGSVNIETDNFGPVSHASALGTYGLVGPGSGQYVLAADYTSGNIKNDKLNFYVRYERKAGDSYIDGTTYNGHSYYGGLRFTPNGKHELTFNAHGAPQRHNQANNVQDPTLFDDFGRTWNRRNHPYQENYYFKPVFELHHQWIINRNSGLRTTAFATTGIGGGSYLRNDSLNLTTGEVETLNGGSFAADRDYQPGTIYGNSWKNDSNNNHVQFGGNTTYTNVFGPRFTLVTGGETRVWQAHHYARSLLFEFGDEGDGRAPEVVDEVERRYDYDGDVVMGAVFLRGLISPIPDRLSFMLDGQGSFYRQRVSENPIQQYDYHNREWTDIYARATQDVVEDWDASTGTATATVINNPDADPELYGRDFFFFQPKAGVNVNLTKAWNAFANYSIAKKEPKVGDWYARTRVPLALGQQNITAETLADAELGFGYRSETQALTVNLYRMAFSDKIESITDSNGDRQTVNAGNAVHQGVELSYTAVLKEVVVFKLAGSLADNRWVEMNPDVSEIFGFATEDIVGKVVVGSPLRQAYAELGYQGEHLGAFVSDSYWDRYYVLYDNSTVDGINEDGTLPAFNDLGLGVSYVTEVGDGHEISGRFLANNLLARDQYVDASYSRDYGRDGEYYLGVTQSPLRTFFLTVAGTF